MKISGCNRKPSNSSSHDRDVFIVCRPQRLDYSGGRVCVVGVRVCVVGGCACVVGVVCGCMCVVCGCACVVRVWCVGVCVLCVWCVSESLGLCSGRLPYWSGIRELINGYFVQWWK